MVLIVNGAKHQYELVKLLYIRINGMLSYLALLWPYTVILLMQHTSLSPDGKLVVIVGDDPNGLLIDANSGKVYQHTQGQA